MRAMRARDLVIKPKQVVTAGEWKSGAKMPRTAFPVLRNRAFQLGAKWTWRVDVLEVEGVECRLLTAFEPAKHGFTAWLSYKRPDGYVIAARLEFHGDEPGWHCHASCGHLHEMPAGIVKPLGVRRLPKARAFHRRTIYEISESDALAKSFGFFRVTSIPEGSML